MADENSCPCKTQRKGGKSDFYIICDGKCKTKYWHPECAGICGLDQKSAKQLLNKWYCPHCSLKKLGHNTLPILTEVSQDIQKALPDIINRAIEESNRPIQQTMTKRLEEMEEKLNMYSKKMETETSGIIKKSLNEQFHESQLRETRMRNVIVFGIEEVGNDRQEIVKNDEKFIEHLTQTVLKIPQIKPKNVYRIGKLPSERQQNSSNTSTSTMQSAEGVRRRRPVKITFLSKEHKAIFMKSLVELRYAEDMFRNISVRHDLSNEERIELKEKIGQAKNSAPTGTKIKVFGTPGNFKVVTERQKTTPESVTNTSE